MEAKFLASLFSFLSIFLAISAQSAANDIEDSTEFEFDTALYYGDSTVNIGEPFSITCIIPITDRIFWLKDDEPITVHNLRHGRDEHSFVLSESAIEGEKHKIEAHLAVRHALKVHAGKYKCNNLHTSYHILRVHAPAAAQDKNKMPFFTQGMTGGIGHAGGRGDDGYSTEPGYVTIHDLTPSGENEDDLFTRTWEPLEPDTPSQSLPLPTQRTTTTTTAFGGSMHHGGGGGGHGGAGSGAHHHQHMPNPQQMENELKHKLIYVNTTNFDGSAIGGSGGVGADSSSSSHRHHIDKSLVDINAIKPTSSSGRHHQQQPYQTTEYWPRQPNMIYAATPPNFPPPRTIPHDMEKTRPSQPPQHYYPYGPQMLPPSSQPEYPMYGGGGAAAAGYPAQQHKHKTHENYYQVDSSAMSGSGSAAQYPGAGMHMYPPPATSTAIAPYYQYPAGGVGTGRAAAAPPQQPHFNEMVTFTGGKQPATIYQNPFQLYAGQPMTISQQQQLYHQLQQQQQQRQQLQYMTLPPYGGMAAPSGVGAGGGIVIATSAPMFATSTYGIVAPSSSTQFQATGMISPSGNILLTHPPIPKELDFLVPNYDNIEQQLKVFQIRSPLVLSCNITKEGSYDLTWEKNGTDVAHVKELQGRHRLIPAERKFIIDKTDVHDDGLYACVADNQKRNITVVAQVVVRVPSNTGVVEGEKLSIECAVVGTDPELSWSFGNMTFTNSTGRVILKADHNMVENAILTIENVSLDDRGEYKCIARNAATKYAGLQEASDTSMVRVKGKLAALWPFLGICAEVLILCTIILIYEKRRNKNDGDDSDTDPQEQRRKRRNYD